MILNCIAVDDEPLALELISSFIKQTPFLNLVAAHGSAIDVIEALKKEVVQLIFLDIQMPKLNGMAFADLLHQSGKQPGIIFTTAYDKFAVDSYRVEAIDYLLKPFEYEDFLGSATKALSLYKLHNRLDKISSSLQERHIFVRVGYQSVKVLLDQITYLEAQKDYVKIYVEGPGRPIVTLATLKSLEQKLPQDQFIRVQRSFIVSSGKITASTKSSVWIGDLEITIGERYRNSVWIAMNRKAGG